MFTQYGDLFLLAGAIAVMFNTYLIIHLLKEIKELKRVNKELVDRNKKLNKVNGIWRFDAPQILRVTELNAEEIKCLKEQMDLVNKWLGDVLNISNLMPSKESGIEATDVIEELRQRRKWYEELQEKQIDESNFYQGD